MTSTVSGTDDELNSGGNELPAQELIPAALLAGALTPDDVVHRGVVVDQVGRSHAVYRVSVGGEPRFFVKTFGPSRGATDGLPDRERAVLALARERPEVAILTPPEWTWSPPACPAGSHARPAPTWNVVATAAIRGAEAWKLDQPGGGERGVDEAWAMLVKAVAAPLAAFHRATRDLARPGAQPPPALRTAEPWGLRLMDGDAAPELWAAPVTATLLAEAAADPGLVKGVREARAAWRPLALIHADLKHDNVLLELHPEGVRAWILDWEMARIGDPAWDLAGLCARLAVARGSGPPWQPPDLEGVARLIEAYTQASGLKPPPLVQRVVLYTGVVLLMMSLQSGAALPPGADASQTRNLIARSRATFQWAPRLTTEIIHRIESPAH